MSLQPLSNSRLRDMEAQRDAARLLLDEATARIDQLEALTATCTCASSYETYEGPEADCPVHGAVRAFSEATASIAAALKLHKPTTSQPPSISPRCQTCRNEAYPCLTVKALTA